MESERELGEEDRNHTVSHLFVVKREDSSTYQYYSPYTMSAMHVCMGGGWMCGCVCDIWTHINIYTSEMGLHWRYAPVCQQRAVVFGTRNKPKYTRNGVRSAPIT